MTVPSADATISDSYRSEFRRFPGCPRRSGEETERVPRRGAHPLRLLENPRLCASCPDGIWSRGYVKFQTRGEDRRRKSQAGRAL